jgi:tetratricopeptide (TPR) repeat protein
MAMSDMQVLRKARLCWVYLALVALAPCAKAQSAIAPSGARLQAVQLLERAEQISSKAAQGNRSFLLSKIAQTLFIAGAADEARTVLHRAWDSLPEGADTGKQAWIVVNTMALSEASVGDKPGARECIEHIREIMAGVPEEKWDFLLLGRVASVQIEIGDLEEAEKIIRLIPVSTSTKLERLGDLAEARVRRGDLEGARRCARAPDTLAAAVLQRIVAAQIKTGDLIGAAETAATIPASGPRASAEASVAVAQFNAGDKTASTMSTSHFLKLAAGNDTALKDIAMAQAKMGNFAYAIQSLNAIEDREYTPKSMWFADIALLAFKAGQSDLVADLLSRAMELTKLAKDDQARSQWVQRVMLVRAETGDVPAALAYANELSDMDRIRFLDQLATIQAKAGDIVGAERTISQTPEAHAMPSTGEIALAKAKNGDFAGASQTANWLGEAQLEIMRAQAKKGDLAGALSEAAKLRAPGMQVDALIGIAKGLLELSSVTESTTSQDRVH